MTAQRIAHPLLALLFAACAAPAPSEADAAVIVRSYRTWFRTAHCYGWRVASTTAVTAYHCAPHGTRLGEDLAAVHVAPGPWLPVGRVDESKPVVIIHPTLGVLRGSASHWRGRQYETDAPLRKGWSGAAVCQGGRLVGVANRGRTDAPGGEFAALGAH